MNDELEPLLPEVSLLQAQLQAFRAELQKQNDEEKARRAKPDPIVNEEEDKQPISFEGGFGGGKKNKKSKRKKSKRKKSKRNKRKTKRRR